MILADFISSRTEQVNISCKTLIVTVFGDVISIHGNWIWLGSLIESLAPLGYSERLVRTSVFRLVEEEWLRVKKIGRKSYYSLTETAIKYNEKAAMRIYSPTGYSDNNQWLIVLPSFVSDEQFPELKRQLKWLGFSTIASSVYAHPSFDSNSLEETIRDLDLLDSVIIITGKTIDSHSTRVLKKLVFEKWKLDQLQKEYACIISDYAPVYELAQSDAITSALSYLLRLLIIHEFRRVLLKDHELAKDMLPKDWSGSIARKLVKNLYSKLAVKSCQYITGQLETIDGKLPRAAAEFERRFNF